MEYKVGDRFKVVNERSWLSDFAWIDELEEEKNMTWNFDVIAPDHQIDWEEIKKDLSPTNPIALVKFDKDYTKQEQDKIKEVDRVKKRLKVLGKKVDKMKEGPSTLLNISKYSQLEAEMLEIEQENKGLFEEVNGIKQESWRGYVVIHKSIIEKGLYVNITPPTVSQPAKHGLVYQVAAKSHFNKWVKWCEKVKKAKWPEECRNKGKVTVNLVEV